MAKSKPVQDNLPSHLQQYVSVPGRVVCLGCNEPFESKDRLRLRLCSACSKRNSDSFIKDQVTIHGSANSHEGSDDY